MADPEVKIQVRTTEAGGQSALGKVRSELGQLLGAIPGVSTGLGAVASAAGLIGVAMATAAKSIREFAQAEEGIAKLDAALAQFGHLSDDNRQKLQGLAAELQETTSIADDEWIGVLTKLVQFGAKPETIGMDVEAVKNLAGVVGDLGTATTLYAKALQGNYDALSRYGMKVKDLEELQRVAAERGGGQLEARARTLGGLFDRLGNSTSDFFEALGQGMARTGIAQGVLGGLSEVMSGLAERFGTAYGSLQSYNRETAGTAEALAAYRQQAEQVLALTKQHVEMLAAESKLLSTKQRLLDQLTDKQAAMDLARVDLDVATGRMTPEAAIRARAGIRFNAAKAKIEREKTTESEQLRLEEERVKTIEERKAAVDKDLAAERARLAPEEKMARIRALVLSAAQSRQEYTGAAKMAHWGMVGDTEGATRYADQANADIVGMKAWEEQMLARTQNQASLRRGKISTLEGMSSDLGAQLTAGRSQLAERRVMTQGSAVGADMDLATARMEQLRATAGAANGQLDGAARAVASTMGANVDLSKSIVARLAEVQREIANLRAQVRNSDNK